LTFGNSSIDYLTSDVYNKYDKVLVVSDTFGYAPDGKATDNGNKLFFRALGHGFFI